MTPDELRALADALSVPHRELATVDVIRAAAYLRAQADAQPVAWVDVTDSYEGPYIFRGKELLPAGRHDLYTRPAPAVPPLPAKWTERHTSAQTWIEDADQAHDLRLYVSGIMESHDQRIAYAQGIARRLNAAPAAPQAEPKRPAFLDEIDRAKEHVASWPQWMKDATVSAAATLPVTEPKREPNPDEVICPACTHQFRAIPENVQAQLWAKREPLSDEQIDAALQTDPAMILALMSGAMTVGEFKAALRRLARAAERAAYERAAQIVKPKSPRPCDCDACDCGNSGDLSAVIQWDEATMLAAAILALGRQHD